MGKVINSEGYENGSDGLAGNKKFKKNDDIFGSMIAGNNNNNNNSTIG